PATGSTRGSAGRGVLDPPARTRILVRPYADSGPPVRGFRSTRTRIPVHPYADSGHGGRTNRGKRRQTVAYTPRSATIPTAPWYMPHVSRAPRAIPPRHA